MEAKRIIRLDVVNYLAIEMTIDLIELMLPEVRKETEFTSNLFERFEA